MKTSTLLILALLGGVGYYLWKQQQNAAGVPTTATSDMGNVESDLLNNTQGAAQTIQSLLGEGSTNASAPQGSNSTSGNSNPTGAASSQGTDNQDPDGAGDDQVTDSGD